MHTAEAPHLHAGFQACLTVSGVAFVLETEFIQLTRSCYRSVARLKHLHWLRTDWVRACPNFQGNDQLITSLRAPRRCLSLSAQPRANKPSVRRPTSSRRFDYLVVKEQSANQLVNRTAGRLAPAKAIKKELVQTSGRNLRSPRFKHRGRLPPGVGEPNRSGLSSLPTILSTAPHAAFYRRCNWL